MTEVIEATAIRAAMPLSMLLGQSEVWKPRDAEPIRLVDMGTRHRLNTLRFLRRRAANLAHLVVMESVEGPLRARGDMAQDAEADWAESVYADPARWLEGEPLVKALAALVAEDEARARAAATRPRTPEEMF